MKNQKLIKKISFQVAVEEGQKLQFSQYEILRLICYPLTKQKGSGEAVLSVWIDIDGECAGIIEQKQVGITDIQEIDLELALYKLVEIDYCHPSQTEDNLNYEFKTISIDAFLKE